MRAFTQDYGTYAGTMYVFVGGKHADIIAYLKKKTKLHPKRIKRLEENEHFKKDVDQNRDSLFWLFYNADSIVYFDQLPKMSTLCHELVHAIDDISEYRGFKDSTEARAYLFEYLFNHLKRKLWQKISKN